MHDDRRSRDLSTRSREVNVQQQPQEQLEALNRQLRKVQIIEAPGTLLFGLGLYGKFAAKGAAFHPLLNEPGVVNLLLGAGGAVMVWGAYRLVSILSEMQRLKKRHGL